MKKKRILIATVLATSCIMGVAFSKSFGDNSFVLDASEQTNTIELGVSNAFTSTEIGTAASPVSTTKTVSRNTALGNPINFKFSSGDSAISADSTLFKLKGTSNGWLANTTPINGIKTVTINANAAATFRVDFGYSQSLDEYSYDDIPSYVVHSTSEVTNLTSYSFDLSLGGYTYFRLQNLGPEDLDVTSLSITYSCTPKTGYKIWKNIEILPNTEGWNGSQKGGAVINVLNYEDRSTKNLLGKYPYSGAGSIKVPNFLAGLSEGDVVLEVVSRHSPTVSYCDGALLHYAEPLDFSEADLLKVDFYVTANNHGGYCFYIKDTANHKHEWRIQVSSLVGAYSWNTLTLDVSLLKSSGLTNIKSIELVAVGNSQDAGQTCTYAGYKTVELVKEEEEEDNTWFGATIGNNTEGWAGKQVGGATYQLLAYEDRNTKNLLGMYPFSGASSEKVPNFLAGLSEGDTVLEVASRLNAAGDYCDGVKLTYATPLSFAEKTKLYVDFYVTCVSASGYSFYVKDSTGKTHTWRIQNADLKGAYSWNSLSLDVSALTTTGLKDIKTIDLVAVGGYGSANYSYAGYKRVELA